MNIRMFHASMDIEDSLDPRERLPAAGLHSNFNVPLGSCLSRLLLKINTISYKP